MKKKLLFILMLCIFSFNLIAVNVQSSNKSLLDKLQKIELKKKAVLDSFEENKDLRKNIIDETVRTFSEKKKEIDNAPYRSAELSEDGVTPSSFALQGRLEAYNNFVKEKSIECKEKIDSVINLTSGLDDINEYYGEVRNDTISTLGSELIVEYEKYNGSSLGWDINVKVRLSETEVFKTTSFLSYEKLTGHRPAKYGTTNFDKFCDNVDYYDDLFLNGKSTLVFELTYNVESEDEKNPSKYKINFSDFLFYDTEEEFKNKKELGLSSSYTEIQMSPVCDIREAFNYYSNLESILIERQKDIKMKDMGLVMDPIILPAGTDGTYGTEGTYVLFGYWPQSKKADNVFINTDIENVIVLNDWYCYKGSDSYYYVSGNEAGSYYKLEPIKWRVLTNDYQGNSLLLAENALWCMNFGHEDYSFYGYSRKYANNYKNSDVRKWLNETFLNNAFVLENKDKIKFVTIDNSAESTVDYENQLYKSERYTCDNTIDKVFLLSEKEVTTADYGFASYNENDNARLRAAVDYAIQTLNYDYDYGYDYTYGEDQGNNNSKWWLRSPYYDYSSDARYVDIYGKANSYQSAEYNSTDTFVVPALTISSKDLLPAEVSDVRFASGDGKISFSWKNPDSNNFKKTIISMKGFKDIEVKGGKNEYIAKVLAGLKKDREYEFTIKTVDKNGNKSEGIKIKTVIKDVAPADVSDIFVIPENEKITISWTNPEDLDFEKVLISGAGTKDLVIKGNPGEKKVLEIDGLTNNHEYNITIKSFDKAGKTSTGITLNTTPVITTNIPVVLPKGTDGSIGIKGRYVLFGDWPQTIKADDVIIDTSKIYKINEWTCYKGSDNCYYVKAKSAPYDDFYWDYSGNCRYYNYGKDIYYYFSDDKEINKNTDYYFKIEPIKWRVLTNDYNGGKLLAAEKILEPVEFYSGFYSRSIDNRSIKDNNYKYSNVRAYLNGLDGSSYNVENYSDNGFINKAFSHSAIDLINTVTVDNSKSSATRYDIKYSDNYFCENTEDKLFLLSEKEINKNSYGFYQENWNSNLESRRRETTDYAKAKGAYSSLLPEYDNCGWWWLRTPDYNNNDNDVQYIYAGGHTAGYSISSGSSTGGIIPALVISSDFVSMPESDISVDFNILPEVSELTALPLDSKVKLSWKNPDYNNFEKVIFSVGGSSFEAKEPKDSLVTKTLSGLKNGKNYTFTVKTSDKNGNISKGTKISVTIGDVAPAEVSNFDILPGDEKIIISWTNPEDVDFADVLISGLYPRDIKIGGAPGEENSLRINKLENGKTYDVTIKTIDKTGNLSKGLSKDIVPGVSGTAESEEPCDEVSNLQVVTGNEKIKLVWTNPDNLYFDKVIITGLGDAILEVYGDKGVSVSKEITGLENGHDYSCIIKTVNKFGIVSEGVSLEVTPSLAMSDCGYSDKDEYVK